MLTERGGNAPQSPQPPSTSPFVVRPRCDLGSFWGPCRCRLDPAAPQPRGLSPPLWDRPGPAAACPGEGREGRESSFSTFSSRRGAGSPTPRSPAHPLPVPGTQREPPAQPGSHWDKTPSPTANPPWRGTGAGARPPASGNPPVASPFSPQWGLTHGFGARAHAAAAEPARSHAPVASALLVACLHPGVPPPAPVAPQGGCVSRAEPCRAGGGRVVYVTRGASSAQGVPGTRHTLHKTPPALPAPWVPPSEPKNGVLTSGTPLVCFFPPLQGWKIPPRDVAGRAHGDPVGTGGGPGSWHPSSLSVGCPWLCLGTFGSLLSLTGWRGGRGALPSSVPGGGRVVAG